MKQSIEIDGAHGEGGGQVVRTAVAVSAATGVPVRVGNIRARRRDPGLAAQHVLAVRAVAALCDAQCEGVELRSTALSFSPRRPHGGEFEFDVGTAGSVALVLPAMLPAGLASGQRVAATVRGGTDVRAAPPTDYVRLVLVPLLERMGVHMELEIARRGYYPQGGGEVRFVLQPLSRLQPLVVTQPVAMQRVEVYAHVSRLPRQIAERMEAAARTELPPDLPCQARVDVCGEDRAAGPGGAIVLRAPAEPYVLGAGQVAERGVPAERLGQLAGQALAQDLRCGATLDVHAADQLLVFMALADGESAFRAARVSSHASTAMWLLERLTGARFVVRTDAAGVLVNVTPSRRLRS